MNSKYSDSSSYSSYKKRAFSRKKARNKPEKCQEKEQLVLQDDTRRNCELTKAEILKLQIESDMEIAKDLFS